jgi:hypothetical protein
LVVTKALKLLRTRGVSVHTVAFAIYIKKKYLKVKERIIGTQIFHHAKI